MEGVRRGVIPGRFPGDAGAGIVARKHVAVALLIVAGHIVQAPGIFHGPLHVFGRAREQGQALAQALDSLFQGVKLVRLDGAQSVGEHTLVVKCLHLAGQGLADLLRHTARHGRPRPPGRQVAVVGKAAAEFAVFDLALIDPPADIALHVPHVLRLPPGPERDALRTAGKCKVRRIGFKFIVPVFPGQTVFRAHPQQIGQVGLEPVEHVEMLVGGIFLHQIGIIVLYLNPAVRYVLFFRFLVGFVDHFHGNIFHIFRRNLG